MRLRNKKTGEVKEWQKVGAIDYGELNEVYDASEYNSLAELNDEWEDYEPVEPLIEDEKIRKAVRAWADANEVEEVAVLAHLVWGENATEIAKSGNTSLRIVFSGDLGIKMWTGSIEELCGEEEE